MATEFQPYVGPRPFERTEADQNRFFGRDDEASELLSRISAHSAVLFYSQSGAGKTSLINAKLTPMLEKVGFEVLKPARVRDVPPEESILRQLSNIYAFNALRSWDEGATPPALLARMSIPEFLKNAKRNLAEQEDGTPRVAIFDQFEELFTSYQERSGDREEFFDQVGNALEEDRLLRVVFAMREDYIAELDPYLPLLPEKLRTRYRIERLSEEDALLAITEPLRGSEYSYAAGVAEQLVESLLMVPVETPKAVEKVRGESVEPVQLQVVCQNLWDNCQKSWKASSIAQKVVTRKYLEEFGDVDQALSEFYEKAIKLVVEAAAVKEGALRRWFEQYLITSAGTRGTVFRGPKETGDIPNTAVDQLVDQHIIRAELRSGSRWYELTHDRFIPPIKSSNERWFREHSGGEQTPKRLEARAEEWVRDGRKKADLLDEGELLEASRWLESPGAVDVGYSDTLFALVQASRAASEEAARERERILARASEAERLRSSAVRLRWFAAALALTSIIAIGTTAWALRSRSLADKRARDAAEAQVRAETERQRAEDLSRLTKHESERAAREHQRAEQQSQIAQEQTAQALEALAGRRKAELGRARAENEAVATKLETLSTVNDAFGLELETETGGELKALELNNTFLKIYQQMKDLTNQRETLFRMARLKRKLANGFEASGNEEKAEEYRQQAAELQIEGEAIQIKPTGKMSRRR